MDGLREQLQEQTRRLEQLEEINRRDEEDGKPSPAWQDCSSCQNPVKVDWSRCPNCKTDFTPAVSKAVEDEQAKLVAKLEEQVKENPAVSGAQIRKIVKEELTKTVVPILKEQAQARPKTPKSVTYATGVNGSQQETPGDTAPAGANKPPTEAWGPEQANESAATNGGASNGVASMSPRMKLPLQGKPKSDPSSWPTSLIAAKAAADRWKALRTRNQEKNKNRDPDTIKDCVRESLPFLFGGFSRDNKFRLRCFRIYKSPVWSAFFLVVAAANAVSIAVAPSLVADFNSGNNGESSSSGAAVFANTFDLLCFFILTFEILVGVVALGWYDGPRTWFAVTHYHKLDFATWVVAMLEYVALAAYGVNGINLRPFRMLRFLRPVVRLKMFKGLASIMHALTEGLPQLMTVFMLLAFFLAAFSILAMSILMSSFRRRCVSLPQDLNACASDFATNWTQPAACDSWTLSNTPTILSAGGEVAVSGGWPFERTCKLFKHAEDGEYDEDYPYDSTIDQYHNCQVDEFLDGHALTQTCGVVGNPQFGFQHFDHIGGAIVTLFQVASLDGAYDVLHHALLSEPQATAGIWVLFFFISCLCSFLLLGLFVAVVTNTFKRVRSMYGAGFLSDEQEKQQMEERIKRALSDQLYPAEATPNLIHEAAEQGSVSPFAQRTPRDTTVVQAAVRRRDAPDDDHDADDAVIQEYALVVVNDHRFYHFFSIVILVNCITMAADQYDSDATIKDWAKYGYMLYAFAFATESALHLVASGNFGHFWASGYNRFETLLVLLSIAGILTGSTLLTLLPAFRLYRLMAYIPTLLDLLLAAVASTWSLLNLMLFIILIGLAFAITGRYTFRADMDAITRSNFGTFDNACLTTFQLLTGDSWSGVLYSAMAAKSTTYGQLFAAVFIMSWFIFAQFIITSLFISVIIENFEVAATIEAIEKPGSLSHFRKMLHESYRGLFSRSRRVDARIVPDDTERMTVVPLHPSQQKYNAASEAHHKRGEGSHLFPQVQWLPGEDGDRGAVGPSKLSRYVMRKVEEIPDSRGTATASTEERILFFLAPSNSLREIARAMERSKWFEYVIYLAIIGSSIFVLMTPPADDVPGYEHPMDPDTTAMINTIFVVVFSVEFAVRVLSRGLYFTREAYLKDGWNKLDFIILLFSWIDESGAFQEGGNIANMARLGRVLRLMRIMKRNPKMKAIVDALLCTLRPVAYVIIFTTFTFVVFALISMGLFGGKFYRCTTPGAEYPGGRIECTGLHVTDSGLMLQRVWNKPAYNFDSFYQATFTLYRVNTIKWVGIVQDAMDVTELNTSPEQDHSRANALFFVVYLLVGGLFVMNLFVGFIIDSFNHSRGASEADIIYRRYQRLLISHGPIKNVVKYPTNKISTRIRNIVETGWYQTFSSVCVGINVALMMADHADASDAFSQFMDRQNDLFFAQLAIEVMMFFVAYGPGCFVEDRWKLFDLVVLLGTCGGYFANQPRVAQFVKSFRLMRVVRMMARVKSIRLILETIINCIPQLIDILILLFLVYAMFAATAVVSFGTTKYGGRLGPTANFNTWPQAMQTVYQMVTGDEWMDIMYDCAVAEPECTEKFDREHVYGWPEHWPDYSFGDCGSSGARFYFFFFKVICESVMLNLFVGMILDNFGFITDNVAENQDEDWSDGPSSDQVQHITTIFNQVARGGFGYMQLGLVPTFLRSVPPPVGFKGKKRASLKKLAWPVPAAAQPTDSAPAAGKGSPPKALRLISEVAAMKKERRDSLLDPSEPSGNPITDLTEKMQVQERLVIAELNIIMIQAQKEEYERNEKRSLRNTVLKLISSKTATAINGVEYKDVMMVLLHWRKPELVPMWVKQARKERMKDVLVMVYALKIAGAVKLRSGMRLMALAKPILDEQRTCRQWRETEPHSKRRLQLVRQHKQLHKDKFGRSNPFLPPSKMIKMDLVRVAQVPAYRPHADVVTAEFGKIETTAKHGMDAFTKHAQTQLVLIKFLDPRYSQFGEMLVDFTKLTWLGWGESQQEADCYMEPQRFDLQKRTRWMGMDMVMSGGTEPVPRPPKGAEEAHVLIGNLLDLQSFVDRELEDGLPKNASRVRLNIGEYGVAMQFGKAAHSSGFHSTHVKHVMEGIKNTMGEDVFAESLTDCPDKGRRLPVFFDGVAEVLGYVDKSTVPQLLMPAEFNVTSANNSYHGSAAQSPAAPAGEGRHF